MGNRISRLVRKFLQEGPDPALAERSISVSELKRYLNCRLRWSLTVAPPRGRGLQSRGGLASPDLTLGRVVHAALQEGYDKPESTFVKEFQNLQDEDTANLDDEQVQLITDLLQIYDDYRPILDKDTYILATETKWKGIKVPGTKATLSGVFDAVIERPDGLWIMDFKTTGRTYTDWTRQDLQATAYIYAARKLYGEDVKGIIFRFILKKAPLDVHKLILKSGKLTKRQSLAEVTTSRNYQQAIAIAVMKYETECGNYELPHVPQLELPHSADGKIMLDYLTMEHYEALIPYVKNDPQFQQMFKTGKGLYFQQLSDLKGAWRHWIWDVEEVRTPLQVTNYLQTVFAPSMNEMISEPEVGPTGLSMAWALCGRCPFSEVCKLAMDGANYERVLETDFEVSERYRNETGKNS